jgi:hypothetical protein
MRFSINFIFPRNNRRLSGACPGPRIYKGEIHAIRLTFHKANRAKKKAELTKRLGRIQHLVKQENFDKIEKLLQAKYG